MKNDEMTELIKRMRARWRDLFRRRRVSVLDATDNSEEWHVHLSPAGILAGLVSFTLMLFILTLSLVAYTSVLEMLPGYRTEADRSRENVMQNIIRVDSMARVMEEMMTYNENIALILEGRTPVSRQIASTDTARYDRLPVAASAADSLLRAQIEGDGPYAIRREQEEQGRRVREALELAPPVAGIVTDRFDIAAGRAGIRIAAAPGEGIASIARGTTVLSLWNPESGYVVCIQHPGNLLSVYRHLSQSLVTAGQTVRRGEMIGNGAVPTAESDGEQLEFELWIDGKPVDPERYILF